MAGTGAIGGDFGHKGSSVDYGHKFSPQKSNNQVKNIFGHNDGNYLNKVLERNGGIVPIGSASTRI